jgi:hypothetical protein
VRPTGGESVESILEQQDDVLMLPEPGDELARTLLPRIERQAEDTTARGATSRAYLGHLKLRLGDAAAARQEAERALDQDPTNPLCWAIRAQARLAASDDAGALDDARLGEALSSASPSWSLLADAEARASMGDTAAAVARYRAMLEQRLLPVREGIEVEVRARVTWLEQRR